MFTPLRMVDLMVQWSLLHYYNRALNTTEIMNIVRAGPDLRTCVTDPIVPPYLSMQWYFDNLKIRQ